MCIKRRAAACATEPRFTCSGDENSDNETKENQRRTRWILKLRQQTMRSDAIASWAGVLHDRRQRVAAPNDLKLSDDSEMAGRLRKLPT